MAELTNADAVLNGDVLELIGTSGDDTITVDYDFNDPAATSFLIDGGDGYDTLVLQNDAFYHGGTILGIEATVLDGDCLVEASLVDDLGEISVANFTYSTLLLYDLDGQSVIMDYTLETGASLTVQTFGSTGESFSIDFSACADGARFSGSDADETVIGSAAWDQLDGSAGNDWLFGGDGHDVLKGGFGRDVLYGGRGPDTDDLYGGADADVFVVGPGEGDVRLFDFEPGVDRIALLGVPPAFDDVTDLLPYVSISNSAGVYIEGAGTTIWIASIDSASELSPSDFLLL